MSVKDLLPRDGDKVVVYVQVDVDLQFKLGQPYIKLPITTSPMFTAHHGGPSPCQTGLARTKRP